MKKIPLFFFLLLHHGNGQNIVANLVVEDDCLFRGSMVGYSDSTVLVTGCKGDLQGVQIQSQLFGDMMFTMQDGVVYPLGSERYKRDTDSDYDYEDYDDVLENPMFETRFGTLDNAEAEDLSPPPSQLELHINVYVDKLWRGEFGRSGPRVVRNIMEQSALLLNHHTLRTKIKLVYDEKNLHTSSEHLLPRNSLSFYNEELPKHLNGQNLTPRGEPMVHLYLTVEGNGEKSFILGKAMLNSMCGFKKPRLIVVHREEALRTAMTVAHELGHILGLEHDFTLGKRAKTCGGTTKKGPFVMNYGDTRQSFSECSNIDFKTYYHLVVAEKGNFCLTEGLVGCQCNGVENILGFGKCTETPTGAKCFVNEDSGCKDMALYNGQFLSSSPCTSENGQKEEPKDFSLGYEISSSGGAKAEYPELMGLYVLTGETHNSFPTYKHENGDYYLYVNDEPYDDWIVSNPGYGNGAYLFANKQADQTGPPTTGWEFEKNGFLSDPTMRVIEEELKGYVLESSGRAAEYYGGRLGLYEEIESDYANSKVFRQRGGTAFIYKKGDKWWCGTTVGASKGYFYTTDLFSKTGEWYYWNGEAWQNDDPTIQFLSQTQISCILQPSILITSTGPANSIRADYLGSFLIVQGVFSEGRPIWKNNRGKVLKVRPGKTVFAVYNDNGSTGMFVKSASGPVCPTDAEAGHSDRDGYNAWQYWDGGKWVEDDTIVVQ